MHSGNHSAAAGRYVICSKFKPDPTDSVRTLSEGSVNFFERPLAIIAGDLDEAKNVWQRFVLKIRS